MRRLLPLFAIALLLAGCGGGETVMPTAETVVGTVPSSNQGGSVPKGDAKAGAALFKSQPCAGCHTFSPAGSSSTIGPDLDKLPDYAKSANQGSLQKFTFDSIKNPGAYLEKGYNNVMPNLGLTDKQIADLVAYLTQG